MNPGRLRHKVQFQSIVSAKDNLGQEIKSYVTYIEPRCSVIQEDSHEEYIENIGYRNTILYNLEMRYIGQDVPNGSRILYKDKKLEVISSKTLYNDTLTQVTAVEKIYRTAL